MPSRSLSRVVITALITALVLGLSPVAPALATSGNPPVIIIGPGAPNPPAPPTGNSSVIVIGPSVPNPGTPFGPPNGCCWKSLTGAIAYQFAYSGGNVAAEITVGANPAGSVAFSVYNDQQWPLVANGDQSVAPVGRGTINSYKGGNLFWKGQSATPLTFYVLVYPLSQPAQYWISLTGNAGGGSLTQVPAKASSVQKVGPVIVVPSNPQPAPPNGCWQNNYRVQCPAPYR
jgi:hypothetical protein